MNLRTRIDSFSRLGRILRDSLNGKMTDYTSRLDHLIKTEHLKNAWFTPSNVRLAVSSIASELTAGNLERWTSSYPELNEERQPLRVAVIMAGNIPLAGFHDFLCVLMTNNNIVVKTSSKDPDLIPFLRDILCFINPSFLKRIEITDGSVAGFDIVIATGSDNSSRYFEHYFSGYPNIIRKNRISFAILEGDETETELEALGRDIFSYFGLGCRNVSKVFVPRGYDFSKIEKPWETYKNLVSHSKYANNYDFNKAVFLVNREKFIDTGYLLIKESEELTSPVAVLYYEYFDSASHLQNKFEKLRDKIQCIVGRNYIPFGSAQSPALWDYADGKDTIAFLLKKNIAGIL